MSTTTEPIDAKQSGLAPLRAHSTPDPDMPPSKPPPNPNPLPDDVPDPAHAPVEEPILPEPPVKMG